MTRPRLDRRFRRESARARWTARFQIPSPALCLGQNLTVLAFRHFSPRRRRPAWPTFDPERETIRVSASGEIRPAVPERRAMILVPQGEGKD